MNDSYPRRHPFPNKLRKQRKGKRSAKQNSSEMTVTRAPNGWGFPLKMRMRHKFVHEFRVSSGIGLTGKQVYSCNGLYDPDITSVGHQPMFFDNMSAIYDHYTCFVSQIDVRFTADVVTFASLYIDDDTSTVTSTGDAAEQPTGKEVLSMAFNTRALVLRHSWDGKKYFGGNLFDNDNLSGTASANPVEQSYYVLQWHPADLSVASTMSAYVTIWYDAVWDELKTQSAN